MTLKKSLKILKNGKLDNDFCGFIFRNRIRFLRPFGHFVGVMEKGEIIAPVK